MKLKELLQENVISEQMFHAKFERICEKIYDIENDPKLLTNLITQFLQQTFNIPIPNDFINVIVHQHQEPNNQSVVVETFSSACAQIYNVYKHVDLEKLPAHITLGSIKRRNNYTLVLDTDNKFLTEYVFLENLFFNEYRISTLEEWIDIENETGPEGIDFESYRSQQTLEAFSEVAEKVSNPVYVMWSQDISGFLTVFEGRS